MEPFAAFALGFGLLQALTYLWCERRHRGAWVHDVTYARVEADLESGFRGDGSAAPQTYVGPERNPRAPLHVRAVALWSIGMGQMVVPGGFLALFGVVFYGMGLLGVPGVLLAGRIWLLGPALLRADPRAVERARATAVFAYWLNTVVLLAAALMMMTDSDFIGLGAFTGAYSLVSFAHGYALERAANTLERHWVRRGYAREELARLRIPRPSQAAH